MTFRFVSVAALLLAACGGSKPAANPESGSAADEVAGKYVSVVNPDLVIELKSGGAMVITAAGLGTSTGTYTVDGEKIALAWSGQQHTVIRNGACLEDPQQLFDKSCKGGAAGEAANVPTHTVPTPAGTWVASSSEGEFRLEFVDSNILRLSATPPGGTAQTREGTYQLEGDEIHATVGTDPMVLKYVNTAWESTSFGFMLRFIKQ